MAIWDDMLTGHDREIYEAFRNLGKRQKTLGNKPALVVIDVNYAFVGFKPEPILEAIKTYNTSCGEMGWAAVPHIQRLVKVAREAGIPIIYSTMLDSPTQGNWDWANRARSSESELVGQEEMEKRQAGNTIIKELEPQPRDVVLRKRGASLFHGTPFMSYLNELDIDTLVLTGTTTSGCVRATAVDAASANFYVGIVEESTFDRFIISHKVALMDMHAKYGTVISLADALSYLETKAEPTFAAQRLSTV